MRFRTRPVEVDAIAVTDVISAARNTGLDAPLIKEWFSAIDATVSTRGVVFDQRAGFPVHAEPGDWIVRHHNGGHLSVVKPAAFADTFDPIPEGVPA